MMLNKLRTKYLYIVLGLLAIILVLSSFLPLIRDTGLKSFFIEAAIGLLIAIGLSLTIERYASEQFRQEVDEALQKTRESVLDATFASLIPPEIYEEVRSLILTRPFIRRDVKCYVSLQWPTDEGREFFELQTRFSYSIQNITNLAQSYTVFAEIERPIDPKFKNRIRFDSFVIGETSYVGDKLVNIVNIDERRLYIDEEVKVFPNQPIEISVADTRYEPAISDYTLLMGLPTIDLTLIVSHPAGIKVQAAVRHPSSERFIKIEGTDILSGWKLKGGILPYQGIKINWYPSNDKANNEVNPAQHSVQRTGRTPGKSKRGPREIVQ